MQSNGKESQFVTTQFWKQKVRSWSVREPGVRFIRRKFEPTRAPEFNGATIILNWLNRRNFRNANWRIQSLNMEKKIDRDKDRAF